MKTDEVSLVRFKSLHRIFSLMRMNVLSAMQSNGSSPLTS